jgi:hypothetical protein
VYSVKVDLRGSISRIASECTYSLSPTNQAFGVAGGSGNVAVTAPAGCNWTAVSHETWITITGGQSGSGSGMVTYTVAPYTGRPRHRRGTVTIGGLTLSVRQSR